MAGPWQRGDWVVLRSVLDGRVRWAFPHTVVEHTPEYVALWLVPGARGRSGWAPRLERVRRWAESSSTSRSHIWETTRVLRLTPFAAGYSVDLYWEDATGSFLGWYVNLQQPLRPTPLGFDTRDQILDIWVGPDGSWEWKDEDEFELAQELGLLSPGEAAAARAEGERAIVRIEAWAPPFCDGWERFRPDPSWPVPELPPGWDLAD